MSAASNTRIPKLPPSLAWLALAIAIIRMPVGTVGEYTDGILQINVFTDRAGLYPPLYGALSWAVQFCSFSLLDLEDSARLISNLSSMITMFYVYRIASRLGTPRAAYLAALLYAVSPMSWRWSVRVMTDSLYVSLGTGALYYLTEAWMSLRSPQPTVQSAAPSRLLALAVLLGGLATLTRYQGVLLAPLLALVFILYVKRLRAIPWTAIAAGLVWLAVPLWMYTNGFVHQQQFSSRTATTPMATFGAWWNTLESFVLISPYYFGYPVFAAALLAIPYVRATSALYYSRPAAVLWGSYAIMLLCLQAAFGSFQYRYMMPLLPMVAALAGVGFTRLDLKFPRHAWVPRWILILSIIHLVFFTAAIMFLQSGKAFLDQRQAAAYIATAPANVKVYANERYGNFTNLGAVKLSHWSGRNVKTLVSPEEPIEPGSLLVLGTGYGGSEAVGQMLQALSRKYQLEPLPKARFTSTLVPLMDDIMVNPMFNQNPLAWVLRYVPQTFDTQIFRVSPLENGASPRVP